MATRIIYTGTSGRTLDLLKPGDWNRSIAHGGLVGMIGHPTPSVTTAVGVPGQIRTGHQITPMTGELRLHIVPAPGITVDEAVAEVRREMNAMAEGTLQLMRDTAPSSLSTAICLNGPVPPLPEVPEDAEDAEISVPIISDEGLWSYSPMTSTGEVTITNAGDDFCWPSAEWWGPATLILPSGVEIILPWMEGDGPRQVSLNPWTSHEVSFLAGGIDEITSETSSQWLLAEGIPVRKSRTYHLTGDARLRWQIKILDPWR